MDAVEKKIGTLLPLVHKPMHSHLGRHTSPIARARCDSRRHVRCHRMAAKSEQSTQEATSLCVLLARGSSTAMPSPVPATLAGAGKAAVEAGRSRNQAGRRKNRVWRQQEGIDPVAMAYAGSHLLFSKSPCSFRLLGLAPATQFGERNLLRSKEK